MAREFRLFDKLNLNTFARRHDGHSQGCLSQSIAWEEGGRLETRIAKCIDKSLHHVGPDHIGTIACKAPFCEIEAIIDLCLAGNPPRANVIAKCRRVADDRAIRGANNIKPRQRATREIFGFHIIGRNLVCDGRQETTDEAHIMIPGQP